jgi:threonine dehydrogenase-like Zn-dependent dehydrogenase
VARVAFTAAEYRADGTVGPAAYVFDGSETDGWEIRRERGVHLRLGPGYRLLRTSHCGVCATDLGRRHLPFPLPQVLGHEVVACDERGGACVVEINASHAACGEPAACAYCAGGLATHCPERLVLGIHGLPGGFGPWLLAPRTAVVALPPSVSVRAATFVEPFAAALHAVRVVTRVPRRRIAVLGAGRLGLLVVAALAAWRRRTGAGYEVLVLARHARRGELGRRLGADEVRDPGRLEPGAADVVVDTTGSPDGFAHALVLAREEVHLKTTCGRPSAGLAHATAMVVDEVALARTDRRPDRPPAGGPGYATVLVGAGVPAAIGAALAAEGLHLLDPGALGSLPFGAADVVAVESPAAIDGVLRPTPGVERGLVRPRGLVLVAGAGSARGPLADALLDRGVLVTTSRCGDFTSALDVLPDVDDLAATLVTAVRPGDRLADAFAAAARSDHLKVVVTQPESLF